MVNVMQQVGGALGLAVLVAVFGTASRNAQHHPLAGLTAAAQGQHVLAHGMATAFGLAALFNVASLIVIVALIRARKLAPQRAEIREEEPAIASS
jgi:NADH:ubiquinone oxidoreductase subunit 6 (subunit J)